MDPVIMRKNNPSISAHLLTEEERQKYILGRFQRVLEVLGKEPSSDKWNSKNTSTILNATDALIKDEKNIDKYESNLLNLMARYSIERKSVIIIKF